MKIVSVVLFAGLFCGIPAFAQQGDLSSARAARYRGAEGRRITVVCQPGSRPERIWGTEYYTDDSSICSAAAHAGVIDRARGGPVTAVITAGRKSYRSSTRGGITSMEYGAHGGSFTIEAGGGGQIDWMTTAAGLASLSEPLALVCPPGAITTHRVWGTDVYTADTPICAAAVHAGLVEPDKGGTITVQSAAGQESYSATTRNGITSIRYGVFPRSFRFAEVVAEAKVPPDIGSGASGNPVLPRAPRLINAGHLEITGLRTEASTSTFTTPELSITGAAVAKPHRVLTAPTLAIQGR